MKIHNVIQGTPEWKALRAQYFTASEAPAMMGCSPYQTRGDLLRQKHTGIAAEVDAATQRRFDDGHATEAEFRPIAEGMVGDDLYPVTGSTDAIEGLPLLASFDGLTADYDTGYEHKLWSEVNARAIDETGEPPIYHCWQMEHQLLVSGGRRILFVTSNGTSDKSRVCSYVSKPERRAALIAGWKQFAADLAAYVPPAVADIKPAGRAPDTLPALRIEISGQVTASNLADFKEVALKAIRGVNRELSTDQDFADAEQSVKWCEEVESRTKAAKDHALSQTASIDALFKVLDDISAEARAVRLELARLVEARKKELRESMVVTAQKKLAEHRTALISRLGGRVEVPVSADFAGVIKGKRNFTSMQDAVDTELARAKIAANEAADRMEANIKSLRGDAHDWGFLFPDLAAVANKPVEDFANLLAARIAAHRQAEDARRQREAEAAARAAEAAAAAAQRANEEIQRRAAEHRADEGGQAVAPVIEAAAAAANAITADLVSGAAIARARAGAPVARGKPSMKLGMLSESLGFTVTAEFLERLGFKPAAVDRSAKLYHAEDFDAICLALIDHIKRATLIPF